MYIYKQNFISTFINVYFISIGTYKVEFTTQKPTYAKKLLKDIKKKENDSVGSLKKRIKIIFSGSLYANPNK